ncbi:MAG: hypothetical protein A3H42_03295 [Deltaproteobacteria bacterium RIFCSPLOWO2_02_FULL_46_8]|nr:MAG: hypothetical protein A3H42_03295 [Deltaproteobacteria bacterium RIFCSPLOWO2_02_FULL_46_8]
MTAALLTIIPETALPVWLQSDAAVFEFQTGLTAFGERIEALPPTEDAMQTGIRQNFQALLAGYQQGTVTHENLRGWLIQIARTSPQTLPFSRQKRFASRAKAVAEVAEALKPHKDGVALRLLTPPPPEPPAKPQTIHTTPRTYSTLVQGRAQLEELATTYAQVYHRYLIVRRDGKYILRVCNLAANPNGMLLEGEEFVASGHLLFGKTSKQTIAFDTLKKAPSFSGDSLRKIFQQILGFQNPNQVQKLDVLPKSPVISRPGSN